MAAIRELELALYRADDLLPDEIRAERRAGRVNTIAGLYRSLAGPGEFYLRTRFRGVIREVDVFEQGGEWVVNVTLATRKEIVLRDALAEFPSERLITQIMLVA